MIRGLLAVLGLQVLVASSITVVFLVASGFLDAKSAAVGGAIAVIPGAFYAWRLIASRKALPDRMLRVHVAAESGKIALTFVMFGVTFAWMKDVSVIPLFANYISVLLMYWLALIVFKRV
jgi:ATP synthase protein I